ncbi:MAG: hypothetical protein ACXWV9_01045 [Flavisolibacter sp.]
MIKSCGKYVGLLILFMVFYADLNSIAAQCSVCTRTAQQLGEKSASGLNAGIMYLAFTPLALVGLIGYWWWKKTKREDNT